MSEKSNVSNSGVGLTTVLFIVFLVLKLTDNIDWSWWLVCSPIWISWGIVLSIAFVLLMFTIMVRAWGGR